MAEPKEPILVYDGTTISDSIEGKNDIQVATIKAESIYSLLSKAPFPYRFNDGKNYITVKKVVYDQNLNRFGVFLYATRDGSLVYTKSPLWVYNPPILIRSSEVYDKKTDLTTVTLKESPLDAAKQILFNYVRNQPLGTPEGDDTAIIYPPTEGNGRAVEDTNADWSTMRGAAGDSYNTAGNPTGGLSYPVGPGLTATTTSNQYDKFYRAIFSINTGAVLPDTCSISKAIFYLYGYDLGGGAGYTNSLGNSSLCITSGSLGTNGDIDTGDYDAFGSVDYCNRKLITAFAGNAWNSFKFNAEGVLAISKTGYTNFFLRDSWDVDNSFGGAWASEATTYIAWYSTKTTNDPYLQVEYMPTPRPGAAFGSMNMGMY